MLAPHAKRTVRVLVQDVYVKLQQLVSDRKPQQATAA
jgi:hypothetical protein